MTVPDEVDIIVCGGGSAGCVPSGRELYILNGTSRANTARTCQLGPQLASLDHRGRRRQSEQPMGLSPRHLSKEHEA